jgi:hypothetical protein
MDLADDQRAALGMLAACRPRANRIDDAGAWLCDRNAAGLVRDGLATAVREPAYYNRRAVLVTTMRITDAGRKALEMI